MNKILVPLICLLNSSVLPAQNDQNFSRQEVIYGNGAGLAPTMVVVQPKEQPKERGIIFLVSDGWFSSYEEVALASRHLSLMIATVDDKMDSTAKDPADRLSSRVQAAACFHPPRI